LWHGIPFDMAIATWLVTPFALWWIWRPKPKPAERITAFAIFGLTSLLGIFMLIAEVEFFKEFQMRLGPLAFEYFSTNEEHNAIIAEMVWNGYPVVHWTLACLAIAALFIWFNRRLFSIPRMAHSAAIRGASTFLLLALGVILIRGGFRGAPLRWGDAYFSENTYANQMSFNGLWAALDALRHSSKDLTESKEWKEHLTLEEAIRISRETVLLPGETLIEPEKFPLLRTSPPNNALVRPPKNVVLVIMESFTARYNDALGAGFGATPNFAELARDGVLFDRAFSASTHTAPGVFATLCSFPILPDAGYVMKTMLGQQQFRSLPQVFAESGRETLFLYNGLFSWDNKEGFFRHQGMQRFIGCEDYIDPTFVDPAWGVCDHDVFNRAIGEFNAFSNKKQPFFSVVLTLSNHSPFNLPVVPGLKPLNFDGQQGDRLRGVQYADWAVGNFMDQAKQQPWFDETLFVFVGDHGFAVPPTLTDINLQHMHVPLLFYAPKLFAGKPEVKHQVASHLDILPTLVGLTGIQVPHQSFGRDLFRLPDGDQGQAMVKRSSEPMLGWIEGDEIYVGSVVSPTGFHRFDLGFPSSASEDLTPKRPDDAKRFARKLDAMVITGLHALERRLAAPLH
jgi:phosphoglycerol transferase MdoB-like AlkP superfamily enzyme